MKYLLTLLLVPATWFLVPGVSAQGLDLNALSQQLGALQGQGAGSGAANPAQNLLVQQALQMLASNPQLLTQLAGSLSPQQQATLLQQTMAIGQQIFTPEEQAKLTAFTATPEGASIAAKIPQLAQQLAPVVLQMYASQSAATMAPAAGN